jgi:N-acetylmuramic acid 6-phosphate etherase
MSKKVFRELQGLVTESALPASSRIDRFTTRQILELISSEDHKIAAAVGKTIRQIEKAVDLIYESLRHGGRLFYIGAGTSGRLGVLDAAECPPTYGTRPSMIQGIIAGGRRTLVRSREGVEDDREAARRDIGKRGVGKGDVVVGIAASWRTPYTLEGVREAMRRGAKSIYICCNPISSLPFKFDVLINPVVGPEVVTGSTRMKAGTATKLVLNMLTTTVMIKLGKTYGNRMVDLQARSEKLAERSKRIIMEVTGVSYRKADEHLREADGSVKTAIVMVLLKTDSHTAKKCLRASGGFVWKAMENS